MTSLRSKLPKRGAVADDLVERILRSLTPQQREFIEDPHRLKLARCSRRAGKTYAIAAYMLIECHRKRGTPVLYAGLTRDSAREAVWPILLDMMDRFGIEGHAQSSALQITFPNGSKITIFGCDTENARNRLRGRKFRLVCFDETGFYAKLDPLVYAVLPMLADYQGTLCLTSSPGELMDGLFYEADQGKEAANWSRYFWTIHQNPHFMQPSARPEFATMAQEELATVLRLSFNGNATHPGYRREWLGEWVADNTTLVYPVNGQNLIRGALAMPAAEHAIGVSFSPWVYSIVVGRFSAFSREFQIIESREFEDATIDDFVGKLMSAIATYRPTSLVAHTGDYSKRIIDELRRRYQLPIVAMDDFDTGFHQKIFANDLQAGYIKVVESLPIVARYGKIVKGPDGEEIDGQANFAPNAALALYRRVYQVHLQMYQPPLSDEERHIQQLEQSRFIESREWWDIEE